jgi:hypothetical protein
VVVGVIEESEPDWAWESVINREERRRGRVKGSNNIFFPHDAEGGQVVGGQLFITSRSPP